MPTASFQSTGSRREQFAALHRDGTFVLANAWDVGSARLLVSLGARAVATTSSGHASSLGRMDQQVDLDELVAHAAALAAAVDVPVSVDSERLFADDVEGIPAVVARLAATGAVGLSIEDHDPAAGIAGVEVATARVAAAAEATREHGLVLTARAENHLYGRDDLDDTIRRLVAYRDAGADCLYAPGLVDRADIARVVDEVAAPVNVLLTPTGPSVPDLAELGVRRVSTGGALALAAYGTLATAAQELFGTGTTDWADGVLDAEVRSAAWGGPEPVPSAF